jgi:hypothetical protein
MALSTSQTRMLNRPAHKNYIKFREVDGKSLAYIEGWHAIEQANRIFGVEAWDRETVWSECIWRTPVDAQYGAAYLTRVRITIRTGKDVIVREGVGAAEAIAPTPGQAHEKAIKASETDATKRALSTLGNCFGLFLYRKGKELAALAKPDGNGLEQLPPPCTKSRAEPLEPRSPVEIKPSPESRQIDKSQLPFGEPKRLRKPEHLRLVAQEPCLICGRQPTQAHHLRFAQPRALGRKVSDEFAVPLCAFHHSEVHRSGRELNWWRARGVDPVGVARALWDKSRGAEIMFNVDTTVENVEMNSS